MKKIALLAIVLLQVVATHRFAQANVWTSFGIDLSAGPGGAHPNSDAAHTSFLGHLGSGTAGTENFESVALGLFPGGTRSVAFPPTSVTGTIIDLVNGATANDAAIRNTPQPPHWFPISGTRYFFTESQQGHPFFDLTFASPVTALGFYGTSFSDYDNTPGAPFTPIRISLDGGPAIDVIQADPATILDGSVHYFGLVSDTPFSTARLINPPQPNAAPSITDGIVLDDITVGHAEPVDYQLNVEYRTPEVTGPLIAGFDPIPPTVKAKFTLGSVVPGTPVIGLGQVLAFDLDIPGNHPTRADLDHFQLSLDSRGTPTSLTWGVDAFDLGPSIIILSNNNFTLEIKGTDPQSSQSFRYFWSESTNAFNSVAGLTGDYNNDGHVDAADYVVWRKNKGTTNTLFNDPFGGQIGQGQYDNWRSHFGNGSTTVGTFEPVPEPAPLLLLILMMAGWSLGRCRAA